MSERRPGTYVEELFKDLYEQEHARKDSLNEAINLPSGIVTVLLGIAVYYAGSAPALTGGKCIALTAPFWLAWASLVLCSMTCGIMLCRMLRGFKYGYTPTPQELEQYIAALTEYYESLNEPAVSDKIEQDLRTLLTGEYAKWAEQNTNNNDAKSRLLHYAHRWMFWALGSLTLTSIFYYFASLYCAAAKHVR